MIKGVPLAARTDIERLQPYDPANGSPNDYALCILKNLDNADKHRLLLVVAATAGQIRRVMTISPATLPHLADIMGRHMAGPKGLGSYVRLEDGEEICEPYHASAEVELGIEPTPGIAFVGASPTDLHPVVPRLKQLRDFVVGVVNDFESKFF